jgi:hypothetical protein
MDTKTKSNEFVEYIVALSPIDNEPVLFAKGDELKLMADGWAILPNREDYEEELKIWERTAWLGI